MKRNLKILAFGTMSGMLLFLAGCFPLLAGTAATGGMVLTDPRTTGKFVDDGRIELLASGKLEETPSFDKRSHINITSYNNLVLLSGEVPDQSLKETASHLILGIDGVRTVFNELQIGPVSSLVDRADDSYLTAKIKSRMLVTRDFPSNHVKVVTEADVVYLMGLVAREQAEIAVEIARQASGTKKVVRIFEYRSKPQDKTDP